MKIRAFAKAEFTYLNSTKKVRILFVKSEVEMNLRKQNRFSTKYLTGRKKEVGGNNFWSRCTKFENIVGIRDLYFVEFHNISWSDVFFVESDL